jgi:outer membrane protein
MRYAPLFLAGVFFAATPARAVEPDKRVLTLDDALRAARTNHPQLEIARAQTAASAARVGEARAPLLPQVAASNVYYQDGTYNQAPQPGLSQAGFLASGNSFNTRSYYFAGVSASELIYDFGQTTGKWNAAKASLRSQQATEQNSVVQVGFNLRSAYYTAAAARALVAVAEETLANQEAHLRQIQGFVEAGTRPEIDLAQARTDRANAKVQLINAQVGYDTGKALLNQAMGVESGTDYQVADPPAESIAGEDAATDELLPVALQARPDLLSLARQIESQELTTKSIKGNYGPALGVSAGVTDAGYQLDNLVWNWTARVFLSWQIFGGGITEEQVRESKANTSALRAQYELQRQQIRTDVEQARLGVRAAKAAIEATHEAAVNARVRLRLAEGRYQAGVGNAIELGDSQVAVTSAAAQEVQAVFNLATARARMRQALGQP